LNKYELRLPGLTPFNFPTIGVRCLQAMTTLQFQMALTKIFFGLALTTLILTTMGLFSFFKKSPAPTQTQSSTDPYKDSSTNLIYNLLFCDNLNLYKENATTLYLSV
jgi:hypothetical protein